MLRRIGQYILAGKYRAIFFTSLLAMLGFAVPLLSYPASGIVPALVTLRKNATAGLQVIFSSMLLLLALFLVAGISPYVAPVIALVIWLPVWFCASVLRLTESQGLLLVAAAVFGLVYITLTRLLLGDVTAWWQRWLELWLEQVANPANRESMEAMLTSMAPFMNAMTAAGLFLSLVCTVFLARWWQAHLFNRGGFRKEFHALRLPRALVIVVVADMIYMLVGGTQPGSAAMDIMLLLMFVYLFQGLATVHRLVARKNLSRGWLTGMYIFMFLLPQTILFMACVGMVDSWLVRRQSAGPNDNS